MRYTTIIDIREFPLYKNPACRTLYLHMVLASGYHETDMDQVTISIRGLATQTGLTVSAIRHALSVLMKAGLVRRQSGQLTVAKYVLKEGIPKRARSKKEQQLQQIAREREQKALEEERQRYHQAQQAILDSSVQELEEHLEKMQYAKDHPEEYRTQNYWIRGVRIVNNDAARAAIAAAIETKKSSK